MPDETTGDNHAPNLYTSRLNDASRQAEIWQRGRPADAAIMSRLAGIPTARWFVGQDTDIEQSVREYVDAARKAAATPVLVVFNIPDRDIGSYSAGGLPDAAAYDHWIERFAQGIGSRQTIAVLEPDALAHLEQLPEEEQRERCEILRKAVLTLKKFAPNAAAYLDAGHPGWQPPGVMAKRLERAAISEATGFSLNVSNFCATKDCLAYGAALSGLLGGKHFVIDTSRNGNGPAPDGAWLNPGGRALGRLPTLETGHPLCDAYLWVKIPGESDGAGGRPIDGTEPPAAGEWWPEYALELAGNAGWSNLQTN